MYGHILAASKLKSAKKAPAGNAYNINDGKDIIYGDWLMGIGVGMGVKENELAQYQIPTFIAVQMAYWTELTFKYFGWCIDPKKQGPSLSMVAVLNTFCHHTSSIEKARRDLGYEPVVDGDTAFRVSLKWFQENFK